MSKFSITVADPENPPEPFDHNFTEVFKANLSKTDENPYDEVNFHYAPVGREGIYRNLISELSRPNKPKPCNVSLLGEHGMGKTTLLKAVKRGLAEQMGLVVIDTKILDWGEGETPADFFQQLYVALCDALGLGQEKRQQVEDYQDFREAIEPLAKKWRFLLIIDDFDRILNHSFFNFIFFSNLRALGDCSRSRWAYFLLSRRSIAAICDNPQIKESKFWALFDEHRHVLGGLSEEAVQMLSTRPLQNRFRVDKAAELKEMIDLIQVISGGHPYTLRLSLSKLWQATDKRQELDVYGLKRLVFNHFKKIWEQRSEQEKNLLRQLACGKEVNQQCGDYDYLVKRGLIVKGKVFSIDFNENIKTHTFAFACGEETNKFRILLRKINAPDFPWWDQLNKLAITITVMSVL